MEISPEVYTIIAAGAGGAILAAALYPIVTRYGLWPSPPTEQTGSGSLENLTENEALEEIKLDLPKIKL